jgi:hypothetical protein
VVDPHDPVIPGSSRRARKAVSVTSAGAPEQGVLSGRNRCESSGHERLELLALARPVSANTRVQDRRLSAERECALRVEGRKVQINDDLPDEGSISGCQVVKLCHDRPANLLR